ncbi:MAG: hypothetical protein Q7S45_03785 [Candidatus Curtissbacteria bacterium]|nr:hypothetical protein [Candidatus Curtissbacteria bacterium]
MAEPGEQSKANLVQRVGEQIKKAELSGVKVDGIFDRLARRLETKPEDESVDEIKEALDAGTYEGKVQSDGDWVRAMMEMGMDSDQILGIWDKKEGIGRDRKDEVSGQPGKP